MSDMPEHDKRFDAWKRNENQDIPAAYRYVESVAHTMDAEPVAGRCNAWHGWALREAFLAGMSAKDAEIATLTTRRDHYKRACIATSNEVTRVLGEALYGPTPEGAPGDVWAVHTPESIADEAASEIATLRAENERMRGEIITYQDAHTTGTEIIDELRAKVEALEAELAYVDVCHACACVMMPSLQLCESCVLHGDEDLVEEARYAYEQGHRVSAARKGGSDG